METRLESLGLEWQTLSRLRKVGIASVEQLTALTVAQLWEKKGIGYSTIIDVNKKAKAGKIRMPNRPLADVCEISKIGDECISVLSQSGIDIEKISDLLHAGFVRFRNLADMSDDRMLEILGKEDTYRLLSTLDDMGLTCGKQALFERLKEDHICEAGEKNRATADPEDTDHIPESLLNEIELVRAFRKNIYNCFGGKLPETWKDAMETLESAVLADVTARLRTTEGK